MRNYLVEKATRQMMCEIALIAYVWIEVCPHNNKYMHSVSQARIDFFEAAP